MKYTIYLEQRLYSDHVLARVITDTEAKALHYKDGYRAVNENYSTLVIGFDSDEQIRNYIDAMKNFFLIG